MEPAQRLRTGLVIAGCGLGAALEHARWRNAVSRDGGYRSTAVTGDTQRQTLDQFAKAQRGRVGLASCHKAALDLERGGGELLHAQLGLREDFSRCGGTKP